MELKKSLKLTEEYNLGWTIEKASSSFKRLDSLEQAGFDEQAQEQLKQAIEQFDSVLEVVEAVKEYMENVKN